MVKASSWVCGDGGCFLIFAIGLGSGCLLMRYWSAPQGSASNVSTITVLRLISAAITERILWFKSKEKLMPRQARVIVLVFPHDQLRLFS